jgi:hypothetical protein
MKKFIVAAVSLTALAGSAYAQQPAAPAVSSQAPAAAGSDATIIGPGITMGKIATMPLKYVEIKDTDLVTSKLVGVEIYNKQNEDIGTISDIVIGNGKSVIGIVASVGGFLGLGSSYVVLDPASVALNEENGSWKAYVDTNKDALSKAPKLDYDKFKK